MLEMVVERATVVLPSPQLQVLISSHLTNWLASHFRLYQVLSVALLPSAFCSLPCGSTGDRGRRRSLCRKGSLTRTVHSYPTAHHHPLLHKPITSSIIITTPFRTPHPLLHQCHRTTPLSRTTLELLRLVPPVPSFPTSPTLITRVLTRHRLRRLSLQCLCQQVHTRTLAHLRSYRPPAVPQRCHTITQDQQ